MKRQATHIGSVSGVVALHGDQLHLLQLLQHGIQVVHISSVSTSTREPSCLVAGMSEGSSYRCQATELAPEAELTL